MSGRSGLHIRQGNVAGLYITTETMSLSLVLCPTPSFLFVWLVGWLVCWLFFGQHGNAFIVQDDNARAHRAGVVQDHLQFRRIMTPP